ncbi:carbohydrate ABC transporter substrate-binding protein (CUT1 family) [Desulfitobacterium sp. LBE]|uniref:ABC transporter substrate-binding protein n=2 Tax=root TaxID=1 RepID=A0A098AZL1_DESHA|nr:MULTISPECIES: extracellular solute-binding protein [Desulfitobacterium]KTE90944.1 ABC transporter substrate-binding protein [Desulfitobacterium hafniense]MEA5024782.1 extracellular solute-binding protein [Desulfitobacterium hafniense]TWH56519.1 carbohydrate ABC transporter substrate-binding protein (CUT1 family) [Desulfitobacterium sp. LBE]CDX01557.1 Extracellular solute-binding protein 1 [Desulfitobacterium hafniense]
MFFKKVISLTMICALLILGTAACGKSDTTTVDQSDAKGQEQITITFVNWASAEEATKQLTLDMISEFEKQNPTIKVKNVPMPFSDVLNQLTIMNNAGNAPDIAQITNGDGMSLAYMGALEPTDNLLSEGFKADLNKTVYDLGLKDNQHYTIPWAGQPMGFWYNKKLMQDAGLDPNNPPQTLDELNKAMDIAKQKLPNSVVMLQIDTTIRTMGLEQEWPLMNAFGAISENRIQPSQMEPYAEWLRDLLKKGYTLPGKKLGEFRALAAQNNLLFGIDQPCFKGIVQTYDKSNKMSDEEFNEMWAVTTMPVGADNLSYSVPGDHNLIILKSSEHKEAAAKFAEFLAGDDYSLKNYVIPFGYVPVVQSAGERFPDSFKDPSLKAFSEKILQTEVRPPWGPDYSKYATDVMTSMQEIITTSKPVPDILNSLQTKLQNYK